LLISSAKLQDTINNPLAIISVTTDDIRRRCISDPDIVRRLDQIDTSLQRIHVAIKDVAAYESGRILETLTKAPERPATKKADDHGDQPSG